MNSADSTAFRRNLVAAWLAMLTATVAACGGGGAASTAPTPKIAPVVSTDTVAFGDERVGTSSTPRHISVSNPSGTTLALAQFGLSEGDLSSFSVNNGCGASLQANSSCESAVTFQPTSSGAKRAKLLLRVASAPDVVIALSGNGTASIASVEPDHVAFDAQPVGTTSAPQRLTVTNSGTASLSIEGLRASGADAAVFSVVSECGNTVDPGASCTIAVSFNPATAGQKSADFVIASDTSPSPGVVLTGVAVVPRSAPGIVDYGSDDPAILLQSSLTSPTSITAVSGGSVSGAPRFDAIKGMQAGEADGANFVAALAGTRLAGQLSIEVEKTLVSQPSPDQISGGIGGSEGYDHSTQGWLTILEGRSPDDTGLIALGLTSLAAVGGGVYQTNFIGNGVHSAGKGDFVRLTLSWNGLVGELYVDGLLHNSITLPPVGSPGRLDLGKLNVGVSPLATAGGAHYFLRNLVLASRPVAFPIHPQLTKVVIYGDSFASQSNPSVIGSTHFDATAGFQLIRTLNNLGLSIGQLVLKDYPGYVLNRNPAPGQSSFQLGANRFDGVADKLADVVNANADYVIIMGGTNDATGDAATRGGVAPTLAADLMSMCRTLLNNPKTKGVIMQTLLSAKGNAAYATPTFVANVAAVNTLIKALPATWDATYPTEKGKVLVVDTFAATGGEAAASTMLKGTLTGALDDLHATAFAAVIAGNLIAEALKNLIAGSVP